jgi:hypothetical protein
VFIRSSFPGVFVRNQAESLRNAKFVIRISSDLALDSSSMAIVGIEAARSVVRGVRVLGDAPPRAASCPSIPELLERLGAEPDDDLRLAISGLDGARTVVLNRWFSVNKSALKAADIGIPDRDLIWDLAPLGKGRTILWAVPTVLMERELERMELPKELARRFSAIGIDTSALAAAASSIPGSDPMIWADESGTYLLERAADARGTIRAQDLRPVTSHVPANVKILTGPLAPIRIRWAKHAALGRPAGLDPEFFVAWGATRWKTSEISWWPHLEPIERKSVRDSEHRGSLWRRAIWVAAGGIFVAALALPIPARWRLSRLADAKVEAEARAHAAEIAIGAAASEGYGLAPPGRALRRDLAAILILADTMAESVRIDTVTASLAPSPYSALRRLKGAEGEGHQLSLTGTATSVGAAALFLQEVTAAAAPSRIVSARHDAVAEDFVRIQYEIKRDETP